eukprot:COSAG05_NODE_2570_length_2887_cov_1.840746_1_plen_180_part_00
MAYVPVWRMSGMAIALANFFGPQTSVQKVDSGTSPVPAIWSAPYSTSESIALVPPRSCVLRAAARNGQNLVQLYSCSTAAVFRYNSNNTPWAMRWGISHGPAMGHGPAIVQSGSPANADPCRCICPARVRRRGGLRQSRRPYGAAGGASQLSVRPGLSHRKTFSESRCFAGWQLARPRA